MASALGSSKYAKVDIIKKISKGTKRGTRTSTKSHDIKGKVTNFRYYESLYSPVTTALLVYVDAGDSLKSTIPIKGNERLNFKIESKYGTLDFSKQGASMLINSVPEAGKESNREAVVLPLISTYELKDKKKQIFKKYNNLTVDDSVRRICKNELKAPKDRIFVDSCKNVYDFRGSGKNPIELILRLAKKAVPVKGDPGYFFYETQKGLNFRSVSVLVSQKPKATYTYTGMFRAQDEGNDYKIMMAPKFTKDQDIMQAVTSGTYVSRNIFFNPQNAEYIEKIYKINEQGKIEKTLGKDLDIDEDLEESITRTNMHVLDVGSLQSGVSDAVNNSPLEWQAKSTMRYNTLHTQMLEIQVPCNLSLVAGDVITVEIENLNSEKCNEGINKHQSGKYLILHLCHSFSANESITSLTLVRDTYGLHTGTK